MGFSADSLNDTDKDKERVTRMQPIKMLIISLLTTARNLLKQHEKAFVTNLLRVAMLNFLVWLVLPIQSVYLMALGLSPIGIGWTSGISGVAGGLLAYWIGTRAAIHGVKMWFVNGSIMMAAGALILSITRTPMVAAVGVTTLLSAYYGMTYICPVVCATCLNSSVRITSMQACDAISSIPRLGAPIIGTAIIGLLGGQIKQGTPIIYFLVFVGCLLMAWGIYKVFSDPAKLIETRVKVKGSREGNALRRIIEMFTKNRNLGVWLVLQALIQAPWWVSIAYTPLFVQQMKHMDPTIIGVMQSVMHALTLLLAIPVGRLADRFGRKKVIYILILLSIFSLVGLLYATSPVTIIIAGAGQGFFFLNLVISSGVSAELVSIKSVGDWFGVQGIVKGFLAQLWPVFAGVVWVSFGSEYVIYLMMAICIATSCLLPIIPETLRQSSSTTINNSSA